MFSTMSPGSTEVEPNGWLSRKGSGCIFSLSREDAALNATGTGEFFLPWSYLNLSIKAAHAVVLFGRTTTDNSFQPTLIKCSTLAWVGGMARAQPFLQRP